MIQIKTDSEGRLLCPECGARLYAVVEEEHSGIPVYLSDPDYGHMITQDVCVEADTLDAQSSYSEVTDIYCGSCSFAIRAQDNPPFGEIEIVEEE